MNIVRKTNDLPAPLNAPGPMRPIARVVAPREPS